MPGNERSLAGAERWGGFRLPGHGYGTAASPTEIPGFMRGAGKQENVNVREQQGCAGFELGTR